MDQIFVVFLLLTVILAVSDLAVSDLNLDLWLVYMFLPVRPNSLNLLCIYPELRQNVLQNISQVEFVSPSTHITGLTQSFRYNVWYEDE